MTLAVHLERPLPSALPVGTATAIFCIGACYHTAEPIRRLQMLVDGVSQDVAAFGQPRPDIVAARDEPDPGGRRFRSGFWATVGLVAPEQPGMISLGISAELGSGATVVVPVAEIDVVARARAPVAGAAPTRSDQPLIAVCMAAFEPDPALFATQIQSLRDQIDEGWICLISDDRSSPERYARMLAIIGDDPRFAVSRSEQRLGFYRNFERAMQMVPSQAELVALCDQDDRWYSDKLQTLRHALGDAQLVYSDLRLADAQGNVLRDTLWKGRRNNHRNLASLLVANTITGAAMLFRREVAELALPFPDSPGFQFHDHWIGLVALASGRIAFVDRPLYDYVQHAGAVFGHVTHGGAAGRRTRLVAWSRVATRWRAAYFYGYLSGEVQALTLLLRCRSHLTPRKQRMLGRYLASSRSMVAFGWLAVRPLRCLAGLTETLGSETILAQGLIWKWLFIRQARYAGICVRRASTAAYPSPDGFSQKRLRRWRARF